MKSKEELKARFNALLETESYLESADKEEVITWLENITEELREIIKEKQMALEEEADS